MGLYDQNHIREFYNAYGVQETQRWEKSIVEQVKLLVHQHYLKQYLCTDDKILELGAGKGIFTQFLAGFASDLTVTDLSPVQLELKQDAISWKCFLDLEIRACQSPGMIESGSHIIAVLKK